MARNSDLSLPPTRPNCSSLSVATSKRPGQNDSVVNQGIFEPQENHTELENPRLVELTNPLRHLDPEELRAAVNSFVDANGLESIRELLQNGAKLAKYPKHANMSWLTPEEKAALASEKKATFWRLPKVLKTVIMTCSIAAIVQGWDQASINGANLGWPYEFGLNISTGGDRKYSNDINKFAFVNAAPFLFAAIVGAWISDPLNEQFSGRRAAIFAAAVFCFFSVIGSAFTNNWRQMAVCRMLLGIGVGAKAAVVPVFAAEVSPAHIRGTLVMSWQLFVAFGTFIGFSANLLIYGVSGAEGWRWQLGSACFPAIPLLVLIFTCPESPRFLIKQKRYRKAFDALCQLKDTPIQAARDLYYIHAQIEAETRLYQQNPQRTPTDPPQAAAHPMPAGVYGGPDMGRASHPTALETLSQQGKRTKTAYIVQQTRFGGGVVGYWRKIVQLFTIERIYRATWSATVVMVAQQLCGVNIIAFYSSTIFEIGDKQANSITRDESTRIVLWLGWGFSLTTFLGAYIISYFSIIDRMGRRFLLLTTIPFLAIILIILGFCLFAIKNETSSIAVLCTFTIMFGVFYAPGLGPVPFTFSSEVFPLINRQVGMSWAVFWNMLGAGVLSLLVPIVTYHYETHTLLWSFAVLNVIAFVLIWLLMYEPKEASLEEMNDIFGVKARDFVQWQLKTVLPWVWDHWVFPRIPKERRRPLPPPYVRPEDNEDDYARSDPESPRTPSIMSEADTASIHESIADHPTER